MRFIPKEKRKKKKKKDPIRQEKKIDLNNEKTL